MQKATIIGIGFVLLLTTACTKSSSNNQATATNKPAASATASKSVIDCSEFNKEPNYANMPEDLRELTKQTLKDLQYTANDRGNLPTTFPNVAPSSKLCGSSKKLNHTYYITSLSDNDMFAYFKTNIPTAGCTVGDIQTGPSSNGTAQLKYLVFRCNGIEGLVSNDPTRQAYSIAYPSKSN